MIKRPRWHRSCSEAPPTSAFNVRSARHTFRGQQRGSMEDVRLLMPACLTAHMLRLAPNGVGPWDYH
jgi:hypothetical protein